MPFSFVTWQLAPGPSWTQNFQIRTFTWPEAGWITRPKWAHKPLILSYIWLVREAQPSYGPGTEILPGTAVVPAQV
jgi:hypothetical protein